MTPKRKMMLKERILTPMQVRKKIMDERRYMGKLIGGATAGAIIGGGVTGFSLAGLIGGAGAGALVNLETKKGRERMIEKIIKKQRKMEEKLRRM